MSRLILALVLGGACALVSFREATGQPSEYLPRGAKYEGIYKSQSTKMGETKPRTSSTDVTFIVKERDGNTFTGEMWLDKGKRGVRVKGTADARSGIQFEYAKELKGDFGKNAIGQAKGVGDVQGETLHFKVRIPNKTFEAEVTASLKKGKQK